MSKIRQAVEKDLVRIAEIEIFNYRMNFYPIFQDDEYYFEELQVTKFMENYRDSLDEFWVYDDGVVKGFMKINGTQLQKLFVEPVLHGKSIGAELLEYAVAEKGIDHLWALEKNVRAISFYERHGFYVTEDKELEEDTTEYLVRLAR